MAGIKNEIVKFIADVELDPQQAAQYQKSLEDCEKSADALRKSIADTTAKMEAMRDAGQESTSQYAALKKSLEADSKALKEAGKNADKYAEALGIGSMSLSQLQKHAKQCRQALANTHKEAHLEGVGPLEQLVTQLGRLLGRTHRILDGALHHVRALPDIGDELLCGAGEDGRHRDAPLAHVDD